MVVLGFALGFADKENPINQIRSDKRPVAEVARIKGFQENTRQN